MGGCLTRSIRLKPAWLFLHPTRMATLAATLLATAAQSQSVNPTSPQFTTLSSEVCSVEPAPNRGRDRTVLANNLLKCAGRDVGQQLDLQLANGLNASSSYDALAAIVVASQQRIFDKNLLACDPPRQLPKGLIELRTPVVVLACRNVSDGWPQLVLATPADGALRVVRGPATTYPALVAMLGSSVASQSQTALLADVRALWSTPVVIGSIADQANIQSRWDLARLATARLDHVGAERELRQALEVQTRLFGESDPVSNAMLLDLAIIVANQGRQDEADALIRRVSPAVAQSPRQPDRARLLTYRAQIAALRGDLTEAQAEAGGAVAQWRAMAEPPPAAAQSAALVNAGSVSPILAQAELALALNLEAAIILRTGDAASALVRASEALLTFSKAPSAPAWWRADILATLGEASAQVGRLSAAEQYLKTATQIRREIFGDGAGTLRLTLALARAYQTEGMSTNAVIAYREAIALAAQLQRETAPLSDEDLIPFAQTIEDLASKTDSESVRQGLFSELFAAFQLARSPDRDRTAGLAAANLAIAEPVLAQLLRSVNETSGQEAQARVDLSEEQARPADERSAERAEALAARLAETTKKLNELRGALTQRFPDYQSLTQPGINRLDDVRARLGPDEALAMFIVGRNNSYLQLVKRSGLTVAPVPVGAAGLNDAVRKLRRGLEIEGRSVNDFDLAGSHALFENLFGGAKAALSDVKRLTVIPANVLASLPFSVLVESQSDAGTYRTASWLMRRMAVAHAPTLSSFMALRSTRVSQPAPLPFLAIANPVLGGRQTSSVALSRAFAGCRTREPIDPQLLRSLASLPETGREVEAVARAIGAKNPELLLAGEATEPALRAKRLEDYRILYFATHGLVPGELQCQNEPGLVLTPPARAGGERIADGLLDASEIAGLSLRADLVVLSACNTAAPQASKLGGGSLSGLAEAFFRAGARSVLATHWQVPSQATEQLMRETFGRMGAERTLAVAEALRQAQLAAVDRSETAHPFFWGAFVVLGDGAGQPLLGGGVAQ